MTKKLHYLFLVSFLSTGSTSNIGSEQPKDTTIDVPKKVQVTPSKEKSNVPTRPSFWQDIKNHPFAWIASAIVAECFVFLLNCNYIKKIHSQNLMHTNSLPTG